MGNTIDSQRFGAVIQAACAVIACVEFERRTTLQGEDIEEVSVVMGRTRYIGHPLLDAISGLRDALVSSDQTISDRDSASDAK